MRVKSGRASDAGRVLDAASNYAAIGERKKIEMSRQLIGYRRAQRT